LAFGPEDEFEPAARYLVDRFPLEAAHGLTPVPRILGVIEEGVRESRHVQYLSIDSNLSSRTLAPSNLARMPDPIFCDPEVREKRFGTGVDRGIGR
jgi:hypothetical protein